ncbi:helix-turn-helix transcriptional regulator [Burkholderia sp. Ac-20379]|uniref:helix-turn-helix transcriptional regulator n=1 Tax=Burkholderia sp. Ac-20379 TaxID=2703900 RepID=UPI00198181A6|nr:AraC family transcriptional regulator [Burkholderia sp. Ac-20379]MBN3722595.1 helix-turn-helix transcriptional regulator [Burkholderia sp. Ac-20379]
MTTTPPLLPKVLHSSADRGWHALTAALVHIPRGVSHVRGADVHTLGMHFGPPVNADCFCDGTRVRRVQKLGDFGFVPAGMDSSWEDDADCRILRLGLAPSLLEQVAEDLHGDAAKIDVMPRMALRDARIEAIGFAIKAELEAESPSDPLFIDHLASALAVRLVETATDRRPNPARYDTPRLSPRQLTLLTEFIEANLDQPLHLADLAALAGISVTRLKSLFRNSTGAPVHQYVIRRRAEHARVLIATTRTPASEVALAAGFASQSHMSTTMRRVLGLLPSDIARPD